MGIGPEGAVSHYRDKDGVKCDSVVHLRNGAFGLVEIKLGGDKLIEGGEFPYRRPDGVYVVPLGCFGP